MVPTIGDVTLNMQNYIDMILSKILLAGIVEVFIGC